MVKQLYKQQSDSMFGEVIFGTRKAGLKRSKTISGLIKKRDTLARDNMASLFNGNGFNNIIDETDLDGDGKKHAFKGVWGTSCSFISLPSVR